MLLTHAVVPVELLKDDDLTDAAKLLDTTPGELAEQFVPRRVR
jgi:hypothetical protein